MKRLLLPVLIAKNGVKKVQNFTYVLILDIKVFCLNTFVEKEVNLSSVLKHMVESQTSFLAV